MQQGAVMRLFKELDTNGDGSLTYQEFSHGLAKLNVAPKTSACHVPPHMRVYV